ncbi:MAG TPA: hypothetical protein VFI11_14295 [Anaerolineales bacterium]|nr:hypothetical protein [Anaerolineales bacterium]
MHLDEAWLNEYFDGRLQGAAVRKARLHLQTCHECRTRLARLERVEAALRGLPELTLSHDLSPSVLARLGSRSETRVLNWVAVFETLGAAGVAAYLWPRLADWIGPVLTGSSLMAVTLWAQSAWASIESVLSRLGADITSLAAAFDEWSRVPSQLAGLSMPLAIGLGVAALALGVLGNSFLLRPSLARPIRTYGRTSE